MAERRRPHNSQRRDRMKPQLPLTPEPSRRREAVVSVVGIIGVIIGFLGGGLSLKDRWFPPSIEILDLTPIYISEPRNSSGARGASRGVGVVLHVKTGNRPVSITVLELEGKRCLSFGEWLGFTNTDGKHMDELDAEFNRAKPFQRISFSGRLADRTSPLVLNAWEESYLPFTFLDPPADTPGLLIDPKFLGSADNASPFIRRFGVTVLDVFTAMPSEQTTWTAGHLRNEILEGVMTFQLLAGASKSSVPRDTIRPLRRVNITTWKTGNVASILAERWPSIEIEPSVNREINCYQ
jgi:hypothetical protein